MSTLLLPKIEANRRVLVVDDNRAIHEDFRKILGAGDGPDRSELAALDLELFGNAGSEQARERFEIDSVYQGEQALERVKESRSEGQPYALAFVDVRMPPGLDGIETTAQLLDEDPEIGIVICSAYSDHSWEEMSAAIGDTDRVLILKKPFDTVEVRQLAHALHKRWELTRMLALKMEDLNAIVAERTRELQSANDRLREEAAAREEALHKLNESNEKVTALAYQDGLTGLPNRRLLNEHLEKVLARARRKGTEFALLFLDFDNFKLINDTLGHQAADAVLRRLADSLSNLIRTEDVLALYADQDIGLDTTVNLAPLTDSVLSRVGGDEFVMLLPDTRDKFAAGAVARRLLEYLTHPLRAEEHEVVVTASIGIATYPEDGDTGDLLIRNADTAMYHAKQKGKAAYQYYSAAMNAASVERLTLESGLRRALEDDSLELHYQPQIELTTGRIISAEVLLQWNHPTRGQVPASTFMPIAEDCGLILPIGEWVLQRVCRQAAQWRDAGLPPVPLAVNVSSAQFRRQDVCAVVGRALDEHGVDPSLLSIEITEMAMMSVPEHAVTLLEQLRTLGLSLCLDNFGSGHSSLSYLKRFPIDTLKIDQSFTAEALTDRTTASIVEAIISMARILDLRVLAEGVENKLQFELLQRLGCDAGQGVYFDGPMPAENFAALIAPTCPAAPRMRSRA